MLFTGTSPRLVDGLRGDPIPPQSVVRRLQEKSDRLDLVWVGGGHVQYWGLRERWRNGDPRWEKVQTGAVSPEMAYDVVTIFPPDCTGEDMAAFVEQRWGEHHALSAADAAKEASRIVDAQIAADQTVMAGHVQRVHEESLERHERESRHDLRVRAGVERASPMVIVP